MQRKGDSILANQLEGGVSTEKALLDIKRGVMLNLFHEAIGLSQSATPKYVSGIDPISGVGVIAFDRIKYLPWKDYKPVAEGKDVIVPHVGNVDIIQIPVRFPGYFSTEMMSTDLTRLRNEVTYRARVIAERTQSLSVTLDAEFFDLIVAGAAGQKDTLIQIDFPKANYLEPSKFNYYKFFSDLATELETKITNYMVGLPRKELVLVLDPGLYTDVISHFKGGGILIERVLEFIQNEQITPSKISNLIIFRHPFLNNNVTNQVSSEFLNYNFKGVRALLYFVGAPFLIPQYAELNGVINKDTGNYIMIHRVTYAKGLVYGDLLRVVTDRSSVEKPHPFELNLVRNASKYNENYGFKDLGVKIPESISEKIAVKKLQENYRIIEVKTQDKTKDKTD